MKKRTLIMTVSGLVILALSGLALAGPYGQGRGQGPGPGYGPGACWGYNANLSPEEQQELTQLKQEHWLATRELRNEIFDKRIELEKLFAAENPDEKKIDKVTDELGDLKAKLLKERTSFRAKVGQKFGTGFQQGFGRMPNHGYGHRGGYGHMY